jgi:hypothetical protein
MGTQRFEVESEAWYRAVAEGRLVAVSDRNGERVWRESAAPNGYRSTTAPTWLDEALYGPFAPASAPVASVSW